MQGHLEEVIDIKEQLQQDLTRQQVTYPLNVRQFSSSWFVYLRLFFRCIRKLADMHLKYSTLLSLPAKRMHMAHFSSCALESILGQYTLDKMLNLPKLTKKFDAAFGSFSTNSKRLHFKFSVSPLCSTDLIFAKCTKVVLKGATEQVAGDIDTCAAESVTEALGNADNTETMEVDSDDDGQDDDDNLIDTLIDDAPSRL
ncbi:hypothetical protein MP228_009085 [Amoeboaphelidium protococcarum]|nr:hypothetical protein MP228_009085 [Amoeboaphelidium protococcarum]